MNICIVGTNIPPVIGGLEVYSYELARQLVKKGFKVCLVGYKTFKKSPSSEEKDGITIYRIPNLPVIGNKLYFIFAYLLLKKLHKNFNIDIVHAQTVVPSGFVGALLCRKYKIPFIITSHGFELIVRGKQLLIKPFIHYAFKHAFKIIGVSKEMSQFSINAGAAINKTITFANAVDTDLFSPSHSNLRNKLGIAKDVVLILILRRLHPKTGVQYIVQIAPELIEGNTNVHFLVIGTGPLENNMKNFVNKKSLDKYFTFTGGIPNHQVVDYIRCSDFSVFPSLAEATSIACLEVMSCAKPVVVSNVGGLPEIVLHEKTGIIVDFGKIDSTYQDYGLSTKALQNLKNGIRFLIENKDQREKLGCNARKFVIRNYSWDTYLQKILNIYKDAKSNNELN
jgi:glycosyltransferase involved in cell wall biosynthesis